MNKRKGLLIAISVILLGTIITASNYAFWQWRSTPNKNIVFNTAKSLQNYIVYDEGTSQFVGEFKAGSNYQDNSIHSTITLSKKSEAANVTLVATIHLDVNSIGSNMKKSKALKWVVTKGNATNPGQVLAQGNFIGANNGDTLTLVPNIEVTTTPTEYTVWIWLDSSLNPSDALSGETLDTNVWTEINQVEGTEDRYEITRIGANYQNISATVVDSKYPVTEYAVVATGTTPTSTDWHEIDEPNNIYNLNTSVSTAGTYDVYFKDQNGRPTHKSVTVEAVDTTAPTCTWGNFSTAQIANNETASIDLTCLDNESEITNNKLTVDDITRSNSNITITNINKTSVSHGYKYTVTVSGTETDGETALTLTAGKIKNALGLVNTAVTSSAITVANQYTVTYASTSNCTLNSTTYATKTATYGTAFSIANPSCTGYTFAGWTANSGLDTTNAKYGSSSANTTWSNASTKVKGTTVTYFNNLALRSTKTVTLTANWTANELTFADKTITKSFSTSAQTENNAVNEASNGSGNYSYAITGGNTNSYFSLSGRNLTIKASTPANASGYQITITATDTTTGATKAATYTIIINTIPATCPTTITAYSAAYDGSAHGITVSNDAVGGTVKYRTATSGTGSTWTTTNPTYKDFTNGEKTVYVEVEGDSNHNTKDCGSKTVTITKKELTSTQITAYSTDWVSGNTSYTREVSTGVGSEKVTLTYTPYENKPAGYTYATSAGSGKFTLSQTNTNYSISSAGNFTINKVACNAPTNVAIGTDGKVTWTASSNASSYQISIDGSTFTNATSGVNYLSTITAETGSRTVYVRSVCDTTYYSSPSPNASKATTVYSVALTKGTGISAVSGEGNYITGATVAIDATVGTGYTWSKWTQTSGGSQVSTTKAYSAAITSNWAYTANATANALTFADKTITKTFSTSAQTENNAVNEASNGSGNYSYAITGGNTNSYFSLSGRNLTIKASTPANASGYQITITATDTTTGATKAATYTIKINTIPATCPKTIIAYSAAYDGSAHGIAVSNDAVGGTVEYSSDNNTWSATKPTYKDFTNGAKTIYIRVHNTDGNYSDATCSNSSVNIIKKALTSTQITAYSTKWVSGATTYTRSDVSTGVGSEKVMLTYTPYANSVGEYTYATSAGSGKFTLSQTNTNYSISSAGKFTITDSQEPSPTISGGTTLKKTLQSFSLSCTDDVGVTGYYWGITEPTSSTTFTAITSTTNWTGINGGANNATTYWLGCKDAAGNIGKTSVVVRSYVVQAVLEKIAGTRGTYTNANYETSGSSATYYVKDGTSITLASVYTAPTGALSSTFKGYTTSAPSATAQTPSTSAPTLNANATYYMWFDRITYNVTVNPSADGKTVVETVTQTENSVTVNTSASTAGKLIVKYGDTVKATATATKEGYIFDAWEGDYVSGATNPVTGAAVTAAKIIIPSFKTASYTVTLDKNDGTSAGTTSVTATYQSTAISPATIVLAKKEYTISGFGLDSSRNSDGATVSSTSNITSTATLNGYYTERTGGSKILQAATTAAWSTSSISGWLSGGKWRATEAKTIYAQFSAMPSKTLPTITKDGYTCGWTTSSTGTMITYASGSNLTPSANITLYGVCIPDSVITVKAGNGISALTLAGWTGTGTGTLTKLLPYGTVLDLTTFAETFKAGYSGKTYTKNSGDGTLTASTHKYTVGLGNAEFTISASTLAVPTCVVTGGEDVIYGNNSTITANNTVEYASGVTLHYQFGYSTSATGTLSNYSTNSTSSTYDVAGNYFGIRYYGAKVYATDGTLTSTTCTTGTGTDNRASVRFINAKITFNPNGGSLNSTSYSPRYTRSGQTGTTSMYTSTTGTGTGYSPTASKTGYTFNGWWTAPTGGYQVLTSANAFTGTAVAGYTTTNAWAVLEDKTLYAQFKDTTVPTFTLTGGTSTTYVKSSEATITIADNVALAAGTYNFKYKWSTTSVTCANMTDYETTSITVAEGDTTKSKTLNITNKTGQGTLYVCNTDPILDAENNSVAANTLKSVRMYLDSSGPTATLELALNSGVRTTLRGISDSPGIGVQTPYYYKIDNINNNPTCDDQTEGFINSTATSYTFTTITEAGTYNVCVRLVDRLGNMTHLSDNVEIRAELTSLSGASTYFKSTTYRDKIVDIKFVDSINIPENSLVTYNLDVANVGLIKGWIVNNTINTSMRDLYIGANSTMFASGANLTSAFMSMSKVESVSLGNLNTSNATNMESMFYRTGFNATNFSLNLGNNFDTSNVTSMAYIFSSVGQNATNFSLNLGNKFNTSNVTNMGGMFSSIGSNATTFNLDLGNSFDTGNVTSMLLMFSNTGRNATNFSLDLGNKFDTSNVTDMSTMFSNMGYNATNFSLDLGNKFNTSNVTSMAYMFSNTGQKATNFSLDLGNNFETSNVTSMVAMFSNMGYDATNFNLNLDNKFNTSNVKNMLAMFSNMGYNATTFSLDLGDKFDTSNVTRMSNMFSGTGQKATTFSLDLGNNFDTSNVTSMYQMFSSMGSNATTFSLNLGDKFDTSNVTSMSSMFQAMGQFSTTFSLNLGDKFDTSNVTSMASMFFRTGYNATNFSLDLGDKFDTSNVTSMSSMFSSMGQYATAFNLDLGDKFDTSNVTIMTSMFSSMGQNATNFSLNLGNKFNTSNVTSMSSMFQSMGHNSTAFNLDLGNSFDTGNVKNMYSMFYGTGYDAPNFSLNLGDKFDTSNVTNMGYMFSYTSVRATAINLDLGDKFDTGNVTNMRSMFSGMGYYSTTFSLDLGNKFNTSNVTSMAYMFEDTGRNATIFSLNLGNKFDISNVTNVVNMFRNTGKFTQTNFELDLAAGNFGKLTTTASYRYMFNGFPSNYATIYVKDTDAQNWITSKNSSWGTNFSAANVLVKGAS